MELMKPNPSRWVQGRSGNLAGRPVGARGRFSQRFIADLTDAWEEHGAAALARTARAKDAARWLTLGILLPRSHVRNYAAA
jgi:hypothetical protein